MKIIYASVIHMSRPSKRLSVEVVSKKSLHKGREMLSISKTVGQNVQHKQSKEIKSQCRKHKRNCRMKMKMFLKRQRYYRRV